MAKKINKRTGNTESVSIVSKNYGKVMYEPKEYQVLEN